MRPAPPEPMAPKATPQQKGKAWYMLLLLSVILSVAYGGYRHWSNFETKVEPQAIVPQAIVAPPKVPINSEATLRLSEIRELDRDLRELETKRQKLELEIQHSREDLRKVHEDLQREKQRLEALVSAIERVERWKTVTLVLSDAPNRVIGLVPSTKKLISLREHAPFAPVGPLQYLCLAKEEGHLGPAAILVALKHGAEWVSNSEMVRVHFQDLVEGASLNIPQSQEIGELLRPRDYYETEFDKNRPYLSYRLRTSKQPSFARYLGAVDERLRIQRLTGEQEQLPIAEIAEGSARLVSDEECSELGDGEFLDACLFRVIESLEQESVAGAANIPVHLAIRVTEKGSDQKLLKYITRSMGIGASPTIDRWTEDLETELFAKLIKIRERDARFHIVDPPQLPQVLAKAIVPRAAIGLIAGWLLDEQPEKELRQDLVKAATSEISEELLRSAGVTHMLRIEVSRAASNGAYRIDVRLINSQSRRVLFAAQGDRRFRLDSDLYFPGSGTLVLAEVDSSFTSKEKLQESPPLIASGGVWKKVPRPNKCLVIREGGSSSTSHFRSLFGNSLEYTLHDHIKLTPLKTSEPPTNERLRYVGYEILRSVLPPSGFVASINSSGTAATITIGTDAGIKNGDRLTVARRELDTRNRETTYKLAVPVRVVQAGPTKSEVAIIDSGLRVLFPNDAIRRGDIVFATKSELPVVTIDQFKFNWPTQKDEIKLGMHINKLRQKRLYDATAAATVEMHSQITSLFERLHIPMLPYSKLTSSYNINDVDSVESFGRFLPHDARVTHLICGEAQLQDHEHDCRYQFRVTDPSSNQIYKEISVNLDIERPNKKF